MMMQYTKELEQEPFNAAAFVERMTWRTLNEGGTDRFDPALLHETFSQAIKDLRVLQVKQQQKCENLEDMMNKEDQTYGLKLAELQKQHRLSVRMFHDLDERINSVSTKVLHVGEQLESVDLPRCRIAEAQKLMNHFGEFLSPGPILTPIFVHNNRLSEAADVIQKLYTISQDLPNGKFDSAKKKVEAKYDEIERNLIEEFVHAQQDENIYLMKKLAGILSNFKGYSQCVDAYIEQSQIGTYSGKDIFLGIKPMCERNYKIIHSVFNSPHQVMAKFILNIYHLKLLQFTETKLSDRNDSEKYLKNLGELYSRTVQLSADLSHFDLGSDEDYLSKLTVNIFAKYLDNYIATEVVCLKEKCAMALSRYYDSIKHTKKAIQTGGFQDLRRDLQAVFGARTNLNIAHIEDYGGQTFLSEELAIYILQESKTSLKRCHLLSRESDLPGNIFQITDLIFRYLLVEHCDYALELGLQGVPVAESKNAVQIHFFDVVKQCNAIVHLLEKLLADSVIPHLISTTKYSEFIQRNRFIVETIEGKLDVGLDRAVNAILGWVKIYLQTEQKKMDFKPDEDVDTIASEPCIVVVQQMNSYITQIRDSIDGRNIEALMYELGTKFHRVIYEHLQQYQYNSAGAMCVICDINEYRKCAKLFESDVVVTLFDTLHALCNLLLVKPENLQQVCEGDTLAELDSSILLNFVQLRTDYKSQKLATFLKGLSS